MCCKWAPNASLHPKYFRINEKSLEVIAFHLDPVSCTLVVATAGYLEAFLSESDHLRQDVL